jgi:hypothetical protein
MEMIDSLATEFEHEAQTTRRHLELSVHLRLLNVPVPGSYRPTADERS